MVSRFNGLPNGSVGPAERSGRVQVGDLISSVNQVPMANLDYGQVMTKIKSSGRPIGIGFVPRSLSKFPGQVSVEVKVLNCFVQLARLLCCACAEFRARYAIRRCPRVPKQEMSCPSR